MSKVTPHDLSIQPPTSHIKPTSSTTGEMSTTTTSSSLHSASSIITGDPGLGTLATLPREIRDEIYRYVVKGSYQAIEKGSQRLFPSREPYTTVLRLSKAINHEAGDVHFSESTFEYYLNGLWTLDFSQAWIDRMMKIELRVAIGGAYAHQARDLKTTIRRLSDAELVRGSMHICFQIDYPHVLWSSQLVTEDMIRNLKSLMRYGTVSVKFLMVQWEIDTAIPEELDKLTDIAVRILEPALGPAMRSAKRPSADAPDYSCFSNYLEFHPQEHLLKKQKD